MEERLGGEKDTQIIWTSSRAAMLSAFDINDIQHRHGYVLMKLIFFLSQAW